MIDILKEKIISVYGKEIKYSKDCEVLAFIIGSTTNMTISPNTIRRLFGFIKTSSQISKYILDVLSVYTGYCDWNDFQEQNRKETTLPKIYWNDIKQKATEISSYTFQIIKERSGIKFEKTVYRNFAEQRMKMFMKSSNSAMAFIAPGGYGKSILLAKWYEKYLKTNTDDILFFINASNLGAIADKGFLLEKWIISQLGYNEQDNILSRLNHEPEEVIGKFIILFDAIDEITFHNTKLERVFNQIFDLLAAYRQSKWFKMVISSRNSTWERFITPLIKRNLPNEQIWFNTSQEFTSPDKTNIPPLNYKEIQKIITNTIDKKFNEKLLLEQLDFKLKQIISYPFYLQLFIKIYNPSVIKRLNNKFDLINEFLKSQVYQTTYAEEKTDLIHEILKITNFGKDSDSFKKNDLKKTFPIHLKTAGKYYTAYEQLVSYGIITEEMRENKYGGFVKVARISHNNLFEIFIVKYLIEENQGVDYQLFSKIAREYSEYEILPYLLSWLYVLAYYNNHYDTLKHIFELETLLFTYEYFIQIIGICLRDNKNLNKKLIPVYAKSEKARKHLFEYFVDTDYLIDSYSKQIHEYLKNTNTKESLLFGNSILFLKAFLQLDEKLAANYYEILKQNHPEKGIHPIPIARRLSSLILYDYFINQKGMNKWFSVIDQQKEVANSFSNDYHKYGEAYFEIYLFPALFFTKQYEKIIELFNKAEKTFEVFRNETTQHFAMLKVYKTHSLIKSGKNPDLKEIAGIEQLIERIDCNDTFFSKIHANLCLGEYFHSINNQNLCKHHLEIALEISVFAKYDFYTVYILKTICKYCNEPDKSRYNKKIDSLLKNSGFKIEF